MSNSAKIQVIQYVHDCINKGIEYFITDKCVSDYIEDSNSYIGNKEYLANELLIDATKGIQGHFRIIKHAGAFLKQAECWIHSCCEIQNLMIPQQVDSLCNKKCAYCCKNGDIRVKIEDIMNKSLFRNW